MHEVKLTYVLTHSVKLTEFAKQHLLNTYRAVRSGAISEEDAPVGFVAACAKLYDDASNSLILHTVIGEVGGDIMQQELPRFYPKENYGFHLSPFRVQYQETPAKLDPPAQAHPMIVSVGSKVVH